MAIWKVEAAGDQVYIRAETQEAAEARLAEVMGAIPRELLTFNQVDALPDNEEFL